MIHFSETMLSDMFKDAHGFRPRHYKEWWTEDELKAEYDYLQRAIEDEMARQDAAEAKAEIEFEKMIAETINIGAKDRDTAIRWLMQAEDVDTRYVQDVEQFFWSLGLSYEKYTEYGKQYTK